MAFPFLSLPLELQRETIGRLINHADLRALCLVSKDIEAIAAPLLFHDIALNQYRGCISCSFGHRKLIPRERLTPMIEAISKSKNLCYVRTLSTPILEDQDAIDAMGMLLFKLKPNSLRRFDFLPVHQTRFPNTNHMEYILAHQRKIQNLTLPSHLKDQACKQRLRTAISQSSLKDTITDLELYGEDGVNSDSRLNYWLLDQLDLTRLRRMTLDGNSRDPGLLTRLNLLFSHRVLVGLTHLNVNLWFEEVSIVLQNCPSLEHLTITNSASRLRFEIPGKQRLSSIHFNAKWLEDLVKILNRSRDLKSLVIRNLQDKELRNTELAVAIGGHKESLQFLDFETCEAAVTHIDNQKADLAGYIENIKRCYRLFLLAIPVFEPETFLEDCKSMVEALPCLVALVIYDYSKELTTYPHENYLETVALLANRLMAGIPASSKFLLLCFAFSRDTRPLHNDSQCRCFARRGREALFGEAPSNVAAEEMAVRVKPDQARQLFCKSEAMRNWAFQDLSAPSIY